MPEHKVLKDTIPNRPGLNHFLKCKQPLIFPELYSQSYIDIARRKFGLISKDKDDLELVEDWFKILAHEKDDFTLAFRRLSDIADETNPVGCVGDLFEFSEQYQNS